MPTFATHTSPSLPYHNTNYHHQHHHYQYQQQPQPQQANNPLPWGGDHQNIMLQVGLQYGQSMLQGGEQSLTRHLPLISGIKRYFRVDNQYVKKKLSILLFPFTRKFYVSQRTPGPEQDISGIPSSFGGDTTVFSPVTNRSPTSMTGGSYPSSSPTSDEYAFDLYLPLMGSVTYVILSGFLHGLHHNNVTNEHLISFASSLLFWIILELLVLKVLSYVLRLVPQVTLLDLLALSGYKYITICIVVLLRELIQLDSDTYYIGFMVMYVLISNGFFVSKSLMRLYQREGRVPSNTRLLAYAAALFQAPLVLWLALKPFR
ncbi:Hrf1 family protein [Trypanosoma theileri]|uniref:Protein YIF1 n=1 Tax=Trypanosoma theileri TaxID=67003 RepID=A0A1X0NW97_9TRYP|nr:Hrf1 family protein [Trypanosoma theileri]ORC88976.1 Hrf1 family protein [Trypanosoma theileri]